MQYFIIILWTRSINQLCATSNQVGTVRAFDTLSEKMEESRKKRAVKAKQVKKEVAAARAAELAAARRGAEQETQAVREEAEKQRKLHEDERKKSAEMLRRARQVCPYAVVIIRIWPAVSHCGPLRHSLTSELILMVLLRGLV